MKQNNNKQKKITHKTKDKRQKTKKIKKTENKKKT